MRTQIKSNSTLDLESAPDLIGDLRDYADQLNKREKKRAEIEDEHGFTIQTKVETVDGEDVRVLQLNEK